MFDLNYNKLYKEIDEKLKDPDIPIDERRYILVFEVAIRGLELIELKKKGDDLENVLNDVEGLMGETEEAGSVGC